MQKWLGCSVRPGKTRNKKKKRKIKKNKNKKRGKKKEPWLQSLCVLVTDYFSHSKIRLLVEGKVGEGRGVGGDVWDEMVCVHLLFLCVWVCVCECVCLHVTFPSVLHLLKELVGWVLVTVLLHLWQVALLGGDGSIHLEESQGGGGGETEGGRGLDGLVV